MDFVCHEKQFPGGVTGKQMIGALCFHLKIWTTQPLLWVHSIDGYFIKIHCSL